MLSVSFIENLLENKKQLFIYINKCLFLDM